MKQGVLIAIITAVGSIIATGIPAVVTIVSTIHERNEARDAASVTAHELLELLIRCLQDGHGQDRTVEALRASTKAGLETIDRVEKYFPEEVRKNLNPIREELRSHLTSLAPVSPSTVVSADPRATAAALDIRKSMLKAKEFLAVPRH